MEADHPACEVAAGRWHPPRQLSGFLEFQPGIEKVADLLRERYRALVNKAPHQDVGDILLFVAAEPGDPGNWLVSLDDGTPVGRLTRRTKLGALLADGQHVARAKVKSIEGFYQDQRPFKLNALFYVGPPGCTWVKPVIAPRRFPTRLVGEQYHAAAIARCAAGDPVTLCHEADNPHDPRALVAVSPHGHVMGYIPRDGWLHRALIDEGQGCTASILDFFNARDGFRKVVVEVSLGGEPIGRRPYAPPPPIPRHLPVPAKAVTQPRKAMTERELAGIIVLLFSLIVSLFGLLARHM